MPELRLDYVSPLPPVRTGIADYSTDLLPHLEPLCDLRVVRLPGQPVAPSVEDRWHPVSTRRLGENGRTILYHMGNNQHHLEVERLALERPGVLTLHDLVLHHFLLGKTLGSGDTFSYRRRLELEHGWLGESASAVMRWGFWGDSLQFALTANRRLVRRQRRILVHSDWAREMLLDEEPDLDVRTVPMGIPLPERVEPARGAELREELGIPPHAALLGAFGFMTPMKRPEVPIQALGSGRLPDTHLIVAGEVAENLDLETVVREADVSDRVHVTGFLDYDRFEAAIAACDLCLNLRYPTAGETSAALLRTLALGRPTIVSAYAQFAELPAEAAIQIPVGEGEVEALVAAVEQLVEDRKRLEAMGEAARDYVRSRHDPADAAQAIVAACAGAEEVRRERRVREPKEPTSLTWSRLAGSVDVSGHEPPWPEGERRALSVRVTNRSRARWLSGVTDPGGVVLHLAFEAETGVADLHPSIAPLPRGLSPGESETLEIEVRRPLGPARLRVEPRVLGGRGFSTLGGPVWESEI